MKYAADDKWRWAPYLQRVDHPTGEGVGEGALNGFLRQGAVPLQVVRRTEGLFTILKKL
jgi:hypothetical protein